MIIVATIIIFKQFLKKIILSIVEPQVFVLLLLSSPNFAQDANNGETLIYFSSNWFADFFCAWKKDTLSLRCNLCFSLFHYFFSEKSECEEAWKYVEFLKMDVTEPVNTILQVCQWTLKNEANDVVLIRNYFVLSIRNYSRKLFTMQSWNQVKKVWKRPLRSPWNRWLWWCRLGPWILMRELYISQ